MANREETGGFSINGKWATRIAYQADLNSGQLSSVHLKFIIGRSDIAEAQLTRAQALDVLGHRNLAIIERGAAQHSEATQESIRGELRGPTLHYHQATLPGYQERKDNGIERDNLSLEPVAAREEKPVQNSSAPAARHEPLQSAEADAPKPPVLTRTLRRNRRTEDPYAVPHEIARRFIRKDDRFYFPDGSLAFVDRGTSLRTETENVEVVRSLVAIADARGWQAIRVNGTENFRRSVWWEAMRQGVVVRGYSATEAELADAQRGSANAGIRWIDSTLANETRHDTKERDRQRTPLGPEQDLERHAAHPAREIIIGKLIEYGPAHYEFDQSKAQSYFVKLDTAYGVQTKWGVDLERAVTGSKTQPRAGDDIGVEFQGAKPVTVMVDVLDQAGRIVGQRKVTRHRNRWLVEKREYFEKRRLRAQALREGGSRKEDVVREHPELAGAFATLRVAELFARDHFTAPVDRERFVKLVREALAHAIEHESPLAVPKLRDTQMQTSSHRTEVETAGTGRGRPSSSETRAMERG